MYNIRPGYAACGQFAHVHSGDLLDYYPFIIKRPLWDDKTSDPNLSRDKMRQGRELCCHLQ